MIMRIVIVVCSLLVFAGYASAAGYVEPLSQEKLDKGYVQGKSYAMPQDFVDGQWEGIIAASDGKTYFSFSSHSPNHNGQFYSFDPKTDQVKWLIDLGVWCNEPKDRIGKYNTQGKIHSTIFEARGKLYCSTTSGHRPPEITIEGGHFLSYDLSTGTCQDLGRFDDPEGGLLTGYYEPVYDRFYAISQGDCTLCYLDIKTGKIVNVGSIEDNPFQCRHLISDKYGNIYGSTWDHVIYKYNPKTNEMSCLMTRLPYDPKAPQPQPSRSLDWMTTQWAWMIWDPVTEWWYGIKGNDEYLFKMQTPEPGSHRVKIEDLGQFGFRPSEVQPRFASHGATRNGRTIYYCSYTMGQPDAHLMSYEIDSAKITDHGPIIDQDGRPVSEIHSLVTGSDGKLHAASMIFCLDSKDPSNEWATRGGNYFCSRFLVIDPEKDLKNQDSARSW